MAQKRVHRFKMTEQNLRDLLSGKTVAVNSINTEDSVEFFLPDIGVDLVDSICQETLAEVKSTLFRP